ncbi:MAG: alpha/beta fold hydrolase [Solibacillus sp.]
MSIGVLFLHGFSGGPYEVEPLATYIQAHGTYETVTPTLSGHGEALLMKGYKAKDWLMEAELAYRQLAKKVDEVIVVGFSMGGLLAMYLAIRYPVKKLILLSVAAKYVSPSQLVRDLKGVAADAIHGAVNENKLFQHYLYKLRNVPFSATVEFMKVVRTVDPYMENITCPVFIVQGKQDGIVPSQTAQYVFSRLTVKEKDIYYSETGKHLICYSDDCEEWFACALKFIQQKQSQKFQM